MIPIDRMKVFDTIPKNITTEATETKPLFD